MKKQAIILLVYITLAFAANAQTYVSGFISSNTSWELTGSPYIVTGNVLLDSGYVLTVSPGVVVKFDSGKSIQIEGTLEAVGTESEPVIFTSNQSVPAPGDWGFILFNDKSTDYNYTLNTGSIMENCIVEYAGDLTVGANNAAIRITSSYPFINRCTIRNNLTTGITYFDPTALSATGLLKITDCSVYNNSSVLNFNPKAGGIDISMNIDNVIISGNTIYNNSGGGDAGGISCMVVNGTESIISDNLIYNNHAAGNGGGIISSPVTVQNNLLYNNTAVGYGGGIHYSTSQSVAGVSNNIIVKNTSANGAVYLMYNYFWNSFSQITKNTIVDNITTDNVIDCWLPDGSGIYYNTITRNKATGSNTSSTIKLNPGTLHNVKNNNIFGNATDYQIWNTYTAGGSNNIEAQNNWWGTVSTSVINTLIWDYFDESALSIVYYNPFSSSPDTTAPVTPPVNVIKTDLGGGNIQLSWDANTESDINGYKIHYGSPTGYSFANTVDAGNLTTYTVSGLSISDTIAVTAYDIYADGVKDQFEGHESWFTDAIGKPVVNFSASPLSLCPGEPVTFEDNTIDAESRTWMFQGGSPSVSNSQTPVVSYASPGSYDVKLIVTNIAGTDSATYTGYITVNSPSYAAFSTTVCNNGYYISPSGLYIWTSSGTYNDTITNSLGCDSICTINLTLSYDSYVTIYPISCNGSYLSPGGDYTWTSSGTYYDTLPNFSGCDSLFTIYLEVNNTDTGVTNNGSSLTSNAVGVNYQWLDCDNGNSQIFGENYPVFTPAITGNYSVQVSQGNCVDTSYCIFVNVVGVDVPAPVQKLRIYPNPVSGILKVESEERNMFLKVFDVTGNLIETSATGEVDCSSLDAGLYFLKIYIQKQIFIEKFIKE